jgi:hypothetical protein
MGTRFSSAASRALGETWAKLIEGGKGDLQQDHAKAPG